MTAAQYAPTVLKAGRDLGITDRGIVIGFATVFVESNWLNYANAKVPESLAIPHDAVGSDGYSVGLFQQQVVLGGNGWWWGDAATCMDPYKSAVLFFTRLARLDYNNPANAPGSYAQAVQGSAYPDRYDQRIADAQALFDQIASSSPASKSDQSQEPTVDPNRPDFNEYPRWCTNSQDRDGTDVDLWLLHTQQGGGGDDAADELAGFLISTQGGPNPVSYHYTGSQASDGGVTIVDVVDTDQAAWAVGNSNNRSINFCFAGSSIDWTRDQWLAQAKVIDVAAYLFVQDCAKYPKLAARVIAPIYSAPPGAADHNYCTVFLKDGNDHTDVGPNFPWDVFSAAVAKYAGAADPVPAPTPEPAPAGPTPVGPADDQLTLRWAMLGGQTLVEAIAELRDHLLGTSDRSKGGAL